MSLTLKITSLFVRTLAKPVAVRCAARESVSAEANISQNSIKRNAHQHERFRKICVGFAQRLHRIDMRMRLGLLQDPAVIDRQIAKEVAAAEAARKKSQVPTVKTEAETKAEDAMTDKEREAARKKVEAASKPRIRPLSEAKAIETGANFVAEAFIFSVGLGVIVFEQWRQRRKARNQRDDIREDLEDLQKEFVSVKAELEELKAHQPPQPAPSKLMGFLSGKQEQPKPEEPKRSHNEQRPHSSISSTVAVQKHEYCLNVL
ncbi:hypothetical protein K491DRAFT_752887, partial [Lophiostoma macrostomum CBS 122681]